MIELPYNPRSLPSIMRRRRFRVVNRLIGSIIDRKGSCRILDIGGTDYYWKLNSDFLNDNNGRIRIVCANVEKSEAPANGLCEYVVADATMPDVYASDEFDFIHSNSVIEHVGSWSRIAAMAEQIRTKRAFYVQTPNFWFPIEPHFRRVGYQWMSEFPLVRAC